MKAKTYAYLLNKIGEMYIEALANMYYWDARADAEPTNEIYCKIRNDYAKESSGYYKIISDECGEETIEKCHNKAKEAAKEIF